MKRSELITVIFIATVSVVVSFFITQSIFGGAAGETARIKTAEPINATIVEPDESIFNSSAINPTYEVTIDGKNVEDE